MVDKVGVRIQRAGVRGGVGGCCVLAQGPRGWWLGPGAARVPRRALSARLRAPAHSCGESARLRQLPRRPRLGAEVRVALRHTDRTRGYSTSLSSAGG